MKRQEAPVKI